ncbi:MAG: hypothetical protein JXR80_06760 [Deltaproteobacteria bacterium]|nr:hypothetical protein [Deltaproteobacteria bacterium]
MLLADLFLLRDSPYRYASGPSISPLWMPLLLIATGSFYGYLVALFQKTAGVAIHGYAVEQISSTILFGGNIIAGILISLFFHGGVTLLVWLMARGVGGPGLLALLYRTSAFLLPLALPALPYLAAKSVLPEGDPEHLLPLSGLYLPLAVYSLLSLGVGLFQMFRVTQQVTPLRCAIAVFLLLFFSYGVFLLV